MRLLKKFFVILLVIIVFIFIASRLLIPLIEKNLLSYCRTHLNTSLKYSSIEIDFLSRNIYIKNLAITDPADGDLLHIDQVVLAPAIIPLFKKRFIFHQITLEKPWLLFRLTPNGNINWGTGAWQKEINQLKNKLLVKDILVKDGVFRYIQDFQNQASAVAELRGIFAHAQHCLSPRKRIKGIPLYTKIKMRAYIQAIPPGRLTVKGFLNIPQKLNHFSLTRFLY